MHLWKIRRAIKDLHRASTEAASAAESAHAAAAAAAVSAGTAEESAEQARRSADSAERSVAEITSSQEATGTLPQRQRVKRILIISVSELILLVPFLLWLAVHAHWFIDQQTGEQDVVKLLNVTGAGIVALGAAIAMLVEADEVKRWLRSGPQESFLVIPFLFLAVGASLLFAGAYIT